MNDHLLGESSEKVKKLREEILEGKRIKKGIPTGKEGKNKRKRTEQKLKKKQRELLLEEEKEKSLKKLVDTEKKVVTLMSRVPRATTFGIAQGKDIQIIQRSVNAMRSSLRYYIR
jgi:hypothetical protein